MHESLIMLTWYTSYFPADERERVQKKTFTKWVNSHLQRVGARVNDLYHDLIDGKKLILLLEILSGEKLVSGLCVCINFRPFAKTEAVNLYPACWLVPQNRFTSHIRYSQCSWEDGNTLLFILPLCFICCQRGSLSNWLFLFIFGTWVHTVLKSTWVWLLVWKSPRIGAVKEKSLNI